MPQKSWGSGGKAPSLHPRKCRNTPEKEHWKNRIARRIEQAIESLYASTDANFMDRVENGAKKLALESLGLAEFDERLTQIAAEKSALEREEKAIRRKMLSVVRRCPEDDVDPTTYLYGNHHEVERAIRIRQEVHENELLAETAVGRRILELRKEQEALLDTVWLATSGKQIKQLWEEVSTLLEQGTTPLQARAISIEPHGTP